MSGPFKMKGSPMKRNFGIGVSPMKQPAEFGQHKTEEKKELTSDDILKKRFGTGWKNAKTEGYTVVDGKVVSPKGEDVSNPLENA